MTHGVQRLIRRQSLRERPHCTCAQRIPPQRELHEAARRRREQPAQLVEAAARALREPAVAEAQRLEWRRWRCAEGSAQRANPAPAQAAQAVQLEADEAGARGGHVAQQTREPRAKACLERRPGRGRGGWQG